MDPNSNDARKMPMDSAFISIVFLVLKIGIPVYCLLLVALWLFQDAMIFFPGPNNPSTCKSFSGNSYSVSVNGHTINGWLIHGTISATRPLVIYYGGNAEDISDNLHELHRYNTDSFLFMNYRGFGSSTGKPSESALVDDALLIFDHVVNTLDISPGHTVLMGRSLGSGVAVHVGAKRPVKGILLVTPFDSLATVAQSHYPVFPVKYLVKHPFDSLTLAKTITIPAMMIAASNDTVVPLSHTQNLFQTWNGPKELIVIPGADHATVSDFDDYWRAVNTLISQDSHGRL